MYTKTEIFNFKKDGIFVRVVVNFEIDESETLFEFRKICSIFNVEDSKRNNNCEISLGEITHLAAIFLYESVLAIIEDNPEIIPPLSAFEFEDTDVFEIELNVDSSVSTWAYSGSSTFCKPKIVALSADVIQSTASSLTNNNVKETLKDVSPVLVWPIFVHEFMHHADHLAIFRAWTVEGKYSERVGMSKCAADEEKNPTLLFFILLSVIRYEGIAYFCERYAKNDLKNVKIGFIQVSRKRMEYFAKSLLTSDYYFIKDNRYTLGFHMCFIIALYLVGKSKGKISTINQINNEPGVVKISDAVKLILDNKKFFVLFERSDFVLVKKTLMSVKNFSKFLTLYETACNYLGIPVEFRFLDWEFYRNLKRVIREKTIAGKKITSVWDNIFGMIKNIFR